MASGHAQFNAIATDAPHHPSLSYAYETNYTAKDPLKYSNLPYAHGTPLAQNYGKD